MGIFYRGSSKNSHGLSKPPAPQSCFENEALEARLLWAETPETPLHILQELASDSQPSVKMKLASNPNISWEVVMLLAPYCAKELLQNPSFDLLILEGIDLWKLYNFAQYLHTGIPEGWLRSFAREEAYYPFLCCYRCTPPGILLTIAQGANETSALRRSLLTNPNTPREALQRFIEDPNTRWESLRVIAASRPEFLIASLRFRLCFREEIGLG